LMENINPQCTHPYQDYTVGCQAGVDTRTQT
jgi:hypothetical protein